MPSPQKSESKHPLAPSTSSQHPSSSSKHPFASSQLPSQNSPHPHLASAQDFPPDHFVKDPETDEEHQTLLHPLWLHGVTPPDNLDEEFDPGQYDEEDDNYDDMDLSAFQSRAVLKSAVEALEYMMEDESYSPEVCMGLESELDSCSSQLHVPNESTISLPKKQLPAAARKILEGYCSRLKRELLDVCSNYDLDKRAVWSFVHLGGIPPRAQNHHSLFTTNLAWQHALDNQPVLAQDEVEQKYHDKRQSIVAGALGEGVSVASAMRAWLIKMKKDWERIELQIKTASMRPESRYREMGKAVEKLGTQVSDIFFFF